MKARLPQGFNQGGAGNMQNLLKQAQKIQEDMQNMSAELEERTYTATAGGELVSATVKGTKHITEITISPDVVDPDDIEMLQDLVVAAVNSAIEAAEKDSEEEMAKIQAQMPQMPGLF